MNTRATAWAGLVLCGALGITTAALAQDEAAAGEPAKAAGGVRKDPKGLTGISPFWEAIREGDKAYVARDYASAIAAYQKAIAAQPENPMGHYRAGQAYMGNSQMTEAEQAYVAALRYASADPQMKAKVLFVIADLRERQQDLAGAVEHWDSYASHVKQSQVGGYPATPEQRKQANAKWQEMKAQYADVKERIAKREQEAEAKLKASSK